MPRAPILPSLAKNAEAAQDERIRDLTAQNTKLRDALEELVQAFARMPDAGFTHTAPHWNWWHETAKQRHDANAALAATADQEGRDG